MGAKGRSVLFLLLITVPIFVLGKDNDCTPVAYDNIKVPHYPPAAILGKKAGKIFLKMLVGTDGVPSGIMVSTSSGDAALDNAAIQSVAEWRFLPKKCKGNPVASYIVVPVDFNLGTSSSSVPREVAKDDEPMEATSVAAELAYLHDRLDLTSKSGTNGDTQYSHFHESLGVRTWFVFSDHRENRIVVRTRTEVHTQVIRELWAYLCEGDSSFCVKMLKTQETFMRDHPMPIPPLPPAADAEKK